MGGEGGGSENPMLLKCQCMVRCGDQTASFTNQGSINISFRLNWYEVSYMALVLSILCEGVYLWNLLVPFS